MKSSAHLPVATFANIPSGPGAHVLPFTTHLALLFRLRQEWPTGYEHWPFGGRALCGESVCCRRYIGRVEAALCSRTRG
jgi:hypothetical protein